MSEPQAKGSSGEDDARSAVPPAAIRGQLDRILRSPPLLTARQRREMLRFLVEETLAGRGDRLKGYSIATQVLGRPEDFDPRADPVVRIEARRLRRDLDAYYAGPGLHDRLVISIPKGRYLPSFYTRDGDAAGATAAPASPAAPAAPVGAPAPAAPSRGTTQSGRPGARLGWAAASLLGLLLLVAIALGLDRQRPSEDEAAGVLRLPSVLVSAFHSADGSESARILAEGITQELVSNLLRFPDFRVFLASPDRDGRGAADLDRLLAEEVPYLVAGEIVADAGRIRLSARLSDAASGRVIWSETYARDLTTTSLVALQADLAGEIASALGQPYGIVRNDILARGVAHVPAELESYACVLRAYRYRWSFPEIERGGVRDCLEAAVRRDPAYAEAWAMLGWLHLDDGRYAAETPGGAERAYALGIAAASKALALDPGNVHAIKALSSINHYRGNYEEGWRLAREALARNPHDPDTLAQLGWRLAIRGRFEEGVPLLRRAIDRSISPPGWYYHLVAVDHLMRGEYAAMLATAERAAASGRAVSHSMVAVAAAHLGRTEAAEAALVRMAEDSPRFAADPAAYYRTHQATDEIVAELMRGLALAGWRPPGGPVGD